jgi:hypothetical protein
VYRRPGVFWVHRSPVAVSSPWGDL